MKKIVSTLMTVFALTIMAGGAFAQTNVTPYQGSTYSYSLNGIYSVPGATVSIQYLTGAGATVSNIKINGTATSNVTALTASTLTFDVTYSTNATDGKIKVTVTDIAPTSCSNFIELAIDVQDLPTLDLSILASEVNPVCQPINSTPDDNKAASDGVTGNTFTFTVTPTVTNVSANYGYTYKITLPATSTLNGYAISYSGSGSFDSGTSVVTKGVDTTDDVFTITYNTTTGIASETITATLSNPVLTITNTSGGGTYNGSLSTPSDDITVKTLPSIGSFTIE